MAISNLPLTAALDALDDLARQQLSVWVTDSTTARCGTYHCADSDLTVIATAAQGELTSLRFVCGLGIDGYAEFHRGIEQGLMLAALPVTARPV